MASETRVVDGGRLEPVPAYSCASKGHIWLLEDDQRFDVSKYRRDATAPGLPAHCQHCVAEVLIQNWRLK